jgi:hypothetical protein
VNYHNDLERGIAFFVIRPYLGWRFDEGSLRSQCSRSIREGAASVCVRE